MTSGCMWLPECSLASMGLWRVAPVLPPEHGQRQLRGRAGEGSGSHAPTGPKKSLARCSRWIESPARSCRCGKSGAGSHCFRSSRRASPIACSCDAWAEAGQRRDADPEEHRRQFSDQVQAGFPWRLRRVCITQCSPTCSVDLRITTLGRPAPASSHVAEIPARGASSPW